MTPPILGIFASAVTGGVSATSFESIATVTVGSGGASYAEFTSIPATYTHLQIRGINRKTGGSWGQTRLRFNSDTGNNYAQHFLYGDGSSVTSGNNGNPIDWISGGIETGTTQSASVFGSYVIDILDYANTNKYKTSRSLGGGDNNGSGYVWYSSGVWMNTNAITSIRLTPENNNYAQYTTFALYGIKGAA
jgi:hypothetical protein